MEPVSLILLVCAGFAAGLLDSIAGGGGLISMPALLAAGLPPQLALGTNKFMSMFGTGCAVANFHRKAAILWKLAAVGIPFSLAGSAAGAKLALVVPPAVLGRLLVVLLPPAALCVFSSRFFLRNAHPREDKDRWLWPATILVCAGVGFYDGFFGPGTGTFFIIALVLFARIPLVNASATAKTFNLASGIGGFVAFVLAGTVDYRVGISMAIANVAGNYLGSHYAVKHGGALIQKILSVSLSLLFAYVVWKYYL